MNFTAEGASTNSSDHFIGLVKGLKMSLYLLHFLVALPLHSYILRLIATGSGFAEIFILNLSACEIVNCFGSLFYVLSNLNLCPKLSATALEGLCTTARLELQCLMCVERYLAVVHPLTFLKLKPLRYRIFCCSVAWTISFLLCLCYVLLLCVLNKNIYTGMFSVQYAVSISIQLFCCVTVLRALKQSGPGERKEENHRKRRAFLIILIVTISMCITYVPYTVTALSSVLTNISSIELWLISLFCYVIAGFVPPILYLRITGNLPCKLLNNMPSIICKNC